jgi:hypothetical protein
MPQINGGLQVADKGILFMKLRDQHFSLCEMADGDTKVILGMTHMYVGTTNLDFLLAVDATATLIGSQFHALFKNLFNQPKFSDIVLVIGKCTESSKCMSNSRSV